MDQFEIPIQKTGYGYLQSSSFKHLDLCHEELIDLDSPFATIFASGTLMYTFLFLGDQNAGKSTFLHAFTHQNDPSWLSMLSAFPVLTSTFSNARFLEDPSIACMDEPPFIDTDLGRSTAMQTLDDFLFFLNEHDLPMPRDLPSHVRYVMLQFLELGGDHLDRLIINAEHPGQNLEGVGDILAQSRTLLSQAQRTVYFVNAAQLWATRPIDERGSLQQQVVSFRPAALDNLARRFRFLASVFVSAVETHGAPHEVHVILSRAEHIATWDADQLTREAQSVADGTLNAPSLEGLVEQLLQGILRRHAIECVALGSVTRCAHLQLDGSLHAENIAKTIAMCVRNRVGVVADGRNETAEHLLHRASGTAPVYPSEALLHWKSKTRAQEPPFTATTSVISQAGWLTTPMWMDYLTELDDESVPRASSPSSDTGHQDTGSLSLVPPSDVTSTPPLSALCSAFGPCSTSAPLETHDLPSAVPHATVPLPLMAQQATPCAELLAASGLVLSAQQFDSLRLGVCYHGQCYRLLVSRPNGALARVPALQFARAYAGAYSTRLVPASMWLQSGWANPLPIRASLQQTGHLIAGVLARLWDAMESSAAGDAVWPVFVAAWIDWVHLCGVMPLTAIAHEQGEDDEEHPREELPLCCPAFRLLPSADPSPDPTRASASHLLAALVESGRLAAPEPWEDDAPDQVVLTWWQADSDAWSDSDDDEITWVRFSDPSEQA
eukprot:gnl/Trimastix_PCT/1543.p1 GENE.gnl/Trimastix_PCT/1543~~gnl/Trimastix_PCT/1543.p1  ORF type:complete len:723 (+),score=145.18 gnl/Trimastix_PCT/1543:68-2236(+)